MSVADRLPPAILLARARLEPLSLRRHAACAEFAFRLATGSCDQLPPHTATALSSWQDRLPKSFSSLVLRSAQSGVQRLPRPLTELFRRSPFYLSISLLNSIPSDRSSSMASVRSFVLLSSD